MAGAMVTCSDKMGCIELPRWRTRGLTRESVKLCKARRRSDACARNRWITSIGALGRVTDYVFDNLSQLVKMILPAASPRGEYLYSYDILGNTVASTDPQGNVTQYVYDGLNRQVNTMVKPRRVLAV